uniref:Uncharacterized protein n=1 Tax=Chromera velia CCMP2878 TaxID=1169474 RepID=A0A0G4FYZ7_9ALVE|mmetsp:Transcript_33897/g.67141  ORF Transcript_33897/g.67141 Transcript_33897/m.67141 type:complete len:294 (+) Transcript_33897:143-1024(+)|eukprot:Cvel_19474.t1-p1 / transcript=Cvel_19474.t1 / gene=Cvel_19474 / organism=Chromera_velia_CCMP2878 / gene_product=Fucoxanthin-chlorophyll a-c binding protein,, putative / transcript_product=Fucoxanthin-chlorophyll a-c binding protein,, putative / location=Cvel_scaffold1681:32068-33551(+) / protein_length=293 / sequence_SO=supercontig / SO=protein_coding / is_pseudo=false
MKFLLVSAVAGVAGVLGFVPAPSPSSVASSMSAEKQSKFSFQLRKAPKSFVPNEVGFKDPNAKNDKEMKRFRITRPSAAKLERQRKEAYLSAKAGQVAAENAAKAAEFIKVPLDQVVGSDVELPLFDPWGLSASIKPETFAWYRAAELKHARICMLAALGLFIQPLAQLPDPVFQSDPDSAWSALEAVSTQRPAAVAQILLAIAAIETLSVNLQEGRAPGDYGWDPLKLQKSQGLEGNPEKFEAMQLRELKNGRLAMISVAGMLYQQYLTGQGTWEQIASGHISPFGDGQGVF